jgi:hypothetical protein
MKTILTLAVLVAIQSICFCGEAQQTSEVFTTVSNIMAVSRDDQAQALKIGLVKKEVTIPDVVTFLTTFETVTKAQYMIYHHTIPGAKGTVTLTDGQIFNWELEPGYAARVEDAHGVVTYLLSPKK